MNIGVVVETSLRGGPSNTGAASGRLHIAGVTERGSATEPSLIRSLSQYERVFGGRTPYSSAMYDTARMFWEEGGADLVVSRVVGPAAVKGALTLKDRAAVPVDTVRFQILEPGAHSAQTTVEVLNNGGAVDIILRDGDGVLQRFINLGTVTDIVEAMSQSPYVRATDLGSATVAPTNLPAVTVSPLPLAAGTDDRENIVAATVAAALNAAGNVAPGGAVAAPGYPADVIGSLLLAHAAAHNKIALLSMDVDATRAEAKAAALALSADEFAEYGGLFYPHMIVPDGSRSRRISPEGYVAAVRARAHLEVGAWQVPAGERALTRWATDLVDPLDEGANSDLNDSYVSGIVKDNGRVRLYGWSSLSPDRENLRMLTARDMLNNLSIWIKAALQPHVFDVIDGNNQTLTIIKSDVVGILSPIAEAGGLYARRSGDSEIDPGYSVSVDRAINSLDSLGRDEVNVAVAVRLSPTAQLIKVQIVKVPLGGTV